VVLCYNDRTGHQAINAARESVFNANALPTSLPEIDREVLFAETVMMVRHNGYSDDDDDDEST